MLPKRKVSEPSCVFESTHWSAMSPFWMCLTRYRIARFVSSSPVEISSWSSLPGMMMNSTWK